MLTDARGPCHSAGATRLWSNDTSMAFDVHEATKVLCEFDSRGGTAGSSSPYGLNDNGVTSVTIQGLGLTVIRGNSCRLQAVLCCTLTVVLWIARTGPRQCTFR